MGCGSSAPAVDSNIVDDETASPLNKDEFSKTPHLLVDGVCSCDVAQGELGDCWFLSACAAIARDKQMMSRVMRDIIDIDMTAEDYSGKLTFHFWRFGQWKTVTIDDLLPSKNSKLLFSSCENPDEFWLPLLEKAYAKLHGTYEALEGGFEMDGMVDLTGGLAEIYMVAGQPMSIDTEKLYFKRLYRAMENGAFLTCGRTGMRPEIADGLVNGHAYTITNVAFVQVADRVEPFRLLRIRNPWASSMEWNGDWSDTDQERWSKVSDEVRARIGYKSVNDDGEFWMAFEDFRREFSTFSICTLGPDLNDDLWTDDPQKTKIHYMYGEWRGSSAGGATESSNPHSSNPQYLISIAQPDDDDPDGDLSVVIALMQMYRRKNITSMVEFRSIGFRIYKQTEKDRKITEEEVDSPLEGSGMYLPIREVTGRFEMKPGSYILIPSTANAGEDNKFMLRFYAAKPLIFQEI
ncbi:unnamed protein product [Notodromas monacha]|uniref:Calpain catalytic domain-containing protein n=1 Tax=Notodromas monacha TaxID=399045 RepID=A0A7R9BEF0_9CRUS|nr:unnamed protein product [Notodromas monacha]CAG0912632.1 unnamed protein product [Notodromas monacha]